MKEMITVFAEASHRVKPRPSRTDATRMLEHGEADDASAVVCTYTANTNLRRATKGGTHARDPADTIRSNNCRRRPTPKLFNQVMLGDLCCQGLKSFIVHLRCLMSTLITHAALPLEKLLAVCCRRQNKQQQSGGERLTSAPLQFLCKPG
ncbi:hypothetical protein EYF80_029555 [Liparis tanakae]|uniref:Uncharacterized protein n=1 Tax=Liparis tanakae TaxID=230148 RepID=A0A4Z2H435_9TELE|nr:hypothetical protein EYF80_029555 [Liparis tanakae]